MVLTHSLDHIKENLPWKERWDALARSLNRNRIYTSAGSSVLFSYKGTSGLAKKKNNWRLSIDLLVPL